VFIGTTTVTATHTSVSSLLVLIGLGLAFLCILISLIINHFSEKTPDELNQVGFIVNVLTRFSRIFMFLCKLIHPIKFLAGAACVYFVILGINTHPETDPFWKTFIVGSIYDGNKEIFLEFLLIDGF